MISQSDQSLDSDEISRTSSNSSEVSESDEYMEEEECEGCSAARRRGDEADGMILSLAERLRFSPSKRNDEEEEEDERNVSIRIGEYEPPPKSVTNDKLERFKFLLVNIEEAEDMLDPGEFGAGSGEMVQCEFDDYPDQVFSYPINNDDVARSPGPSWIRRSFEELNLDSVSTEHKRRGQRLLRVPSSMDASSKTKSP